MMQRLAELDAAPVVATILNAATPALEARRDPSSSLAPPPPPLLLYHCVAAFLPLTQVVTTVRDEQLLPGGSIPASRMLPHDVPVDIICTPTQVCLCVCVALRMQHVSAAQQCHSSAAVPAAGISFSPPAADRFAALVRKPRRCNPHPVPCRPPGHSCELPRHPQAARHSLGASESPEAGPDPHPAAAEEAH